MIVHTSSITISYFQLPRTIIPRFYFHFSSITIFKFLTNLTTYPVTLNNFFKELDRPISITSPTPTFSTSLMLILLSPQLLTTFSSKSLYPTNKKSCDDHISSPTNKIFVPFHQTNIVSTF